MAQLLNDEELASELVRPDSADDTYVPHYPSYFSSNLVHFHNGLFEEQEQLNWLRHASHNLPYLAQRLSENEAVISVGYFIKARQFSVTANRNKIGSNLIPSEFRSLKVQRNLVPVKGIVHDNYRPFGTDTLTCGMSTEVRKSSDATPSQSKIGFFVKTRDNDVACVLPFFPDAKPSLDVYRADFDFSDPARIGSVIQSYSVDSGCSVLVKIGTNYSASNMFPSAKLQVVGIGSPKKDQSVLTFRHTKPAGLICQTGYRAAVRINKKFCYFENCFNVIPTTSYPFAKPEDVGSLIADPEGKALGVIIGTSLGQALAMPMSAGLKTLDVTLLEGRHRGSWNSPLILV